MSVVGSSGSGKTTVGAALAQRMGVRFVELDSLQHLEDWTSVDPDVFLRQVGEVAAGDEWVIDGNYGAVVRDGPVWRRADTVVWLDVPKRVAMWQVTKRTIGRVITRRELWNGNREKWSNIVSWDPNRSMLRWVWTTHGQVRERYERLSVHPDHSRLTFVRLRSRRETDCWLAGISRRSSPSDTG